MIKYNHFDKVGGIIMIDEKQDIRKIYVCEILKQTEVKEISPSSFGIDGIYTWDYEEDSKFGLFKRVLGGYKHILTDTIYPKPSRKTGNQHVINTKNAELLVKRERELCTHLIQKYGSYYMNPDVIKLIEDRINNDKQFEADGSDFEI